MRTAIWWFLFSLHTASGATVDFQFDGFTTLLACQAFREALIEHARAPYGLSATVCQSR